mmetsp:Transcript_14900/g.20293  ORF Transcript_14900/g.20293 Transcript_14900/m.20293 type:complete len:252 (-) Transcript_14900:129-884(-)
MSTNNSSLTKQDLFGGAISCSIPSQWRDVSAVRQVPDHQEVYQDCMTISSPAAATSADYVGTGGCLIVEILQRQDDVSDVDAAKFFFDDLADANGCASAEEHGWSILASQVVTVGSGSSSTKDDKEEDDSPQNLVPKLSETIRTACTCIGYQKIAMGRDYDFGGDRRTDQEIRIAKVELCAIRLEDVDTDLLITLTMPHVETSAGGLTDVMRIMQGESKEDGVRGDGQVLHSTLYRKILNSFSVDDWTLFA